MTSSPRGGLASRLAAAAALATVAFVGVLALPVLRGADQPAVDAADGSVVQRSERIGAWLVEADLILLPALGYRLDIRLTRDAGAPAPDRIRPIVVVSMDGMPSVEPPLRLLGAGDYQAEGTLSMPGRWRFGVGFDEGLLDLIVDVPDAAGEAT